LTEPVDFSGGEMRKLATTGGVAAGCREELITKSNVVRKSNKKTAAAIHGIRSRHVARFVSATAAAAIVVKVPPDELVG
jgi:hypothetical protein